MHTHSTRPSLFTSMEETALCRQRNGRMEAYSSIKVNGEASLCKSSGWFTPPPHTHTLDGEMIQFPIYYPVASGWMY